MHNNFDGLDFEPEIIIASFHGMPKKYLYGRRSLSLLSGEDRAAAAARNWPDFGRALAYHVPISLLGNLLEWLRPYTDKTVEGLAKQG